MKRRYKDVNFRSSTLEIIREANEILDDYREQGFDLTLRQLYYQFISRDMFDETWIDKKTGSTNNERSYKKLGEIINNGRLTGLIDWNSIVDRTRSIKINSHWESVSDILHASASQYHVDRWDEQETRVEVWIEKDALIDVVASVCGELDVPYFSCRGYVSQSAMWRASRRIDELDCEVIVLHLGDHDPSGIDMSRDIQDRLSMFEVGNVCEIRRIALTMEQVEELNPPPNPTKITDSRSNEYIARYGSDCWELDALEPSYLVNLIDSNVRRYIDIDMMDNMVRREEQGKRLLRKFADEI